MGLAIRAAPTGKTVSFGESFSFGRPTMNDREPLQQQGAGPIEEPEDNASPGAPKTQRKKLDLSAIAALLAIVAALFAAFFFLESRYAYDSALQNLAKRLDEKILQDRMNDYQQTLWDFERQLKDANESDLSAKYVRALEDNIRVAEASLKDAVDQLRALRFAGNQVPAD